MTWHELGRDLACQREKEGIRQTFCRLLRASWRRFGGVLEVLESVLEALGGVLEGLDGVLVAMLDQDSTKMTNKSKKSEKPWKERNDNQGFQRVL